MLKQSRPKVGLKKLIESHDHKHCIYLLHRASPDVQQWFIDSDIPTLVLGSGIASIPCIDIDQYAAASHAVGVMQRHGVDPTKLIFTRPDFDLLGINRMEQGFTQALNTSLKTTAGPAKYPGQKNILVYREEADGILTALSRLPWERGKRPQGIICSSAKFAMKAISWLPAELSLTPGKDIKLICLTENPWFVHHHHTISHYSMRGKSYTSPLIRSISKLLKRQLPEKESQRFIIPNFVDGGSLVKPGC